MKSISLASALLVAALSLNTFAASPAPAPEKATGTAHAAAHLKVQDKAQDKQEPTTSKVSSLTKQKKAFLKKNPSLEKGH